MKYITLLILIANLLAACEGGNPSKKYPPINLYYTPLEMDANHLQAMTYLSPENTYPHFASYPDDRAKLGIRGNASLVAYLNDRGRPYASFGFDESGNLAYLERRAIVGGTYHTLEFLYDDNGKLAGTYNHTNYERETPYVYDDGGRLIRFTRYGDHWDYAYRQDGSLESVRIAEAKGKDLQGHLFTRMDFNEAGQLVYSEAAKTSNPFLKNHIVLGRLNTPTSCTYTYANRQLVGKVERTLVSTGRGQDTEVCSSLYFYNGNGDLARMEYSGAYVTADDHLLSGTFVIHFDYKYDEHGNWTSIHITLPENYADIPAFQSYLGVLASRSGSKREAVIERDIRYHAFTAEESARLKAKQKQQDEAERLATQKEKESLAAELAEKRKHAPRFTALQGHGLYGYVKSVSTDEMTRYFDEYGNLLAEAFPDGSANEYIYDSPTHYTIGQDIGPFRITCEGNLRKEEDEKGFELPTEYEFDNQGRVIRHEYSIGMNKETATYTYNGTDNRPSSRTTSGRDETGEWETTETYTYLGTDAQGNWTKRKVQSITRSIEYSDEEGGKDKTNTTTKPETIETRDIVYY